MRNLKLVLAALVVASLGLTAQGDKRFAVALIDGGASESAAVADFNNDGKLDIVSSEVGTRRRRGPNGRFARFR